MSTVASTPDETQRFVSRARGLCDVFRGRVAETEELRRLPAASAAELVEAGFARAFVPRRFGGDELEWDAAFDAIRELAKADASHAWCSAIMLSMTQFASYLPLKAQQEIWADGPDVCISGSVLPVCQVVPEGDGFRVTGRSPFASGIDHSSWAFVAGFVPGPQQPEWTFLLVAPGDYTVEDTWHTVGMRGTGSNTIITEDAWVPATHTLSISTLREGAGPLAATSDSALYQLPWASFAPLSFVTPMLGAAQGAFEALRDWTRSRVTKSGSAMADLPTVQLKLAHAAADIDAAELLLRRAVEVTLRPEPPTLAERARSMRDYARSAQLLVGATDAVLALAGSAGFAEANVIQRHWRDVHFASTHISLNDASPIHWARTELGLGPLPTQAQY